MTFENNARDVINHLNKKVEYLESQLKVLTQQTLSVESLAGRRVPYSYVVPIEINQGAFQLLEDSTQVSRAGPFFIQRVYASLRVLEMRDGGDATLVGRYLPLTSKSNYPYIWPAGATGTQAVLPPLDGEWGYVTDASDRERQDKYVPLDILERDDDDGILDVSDIVPEGAKITFKLNPHRPVGNSTPWSDEDGVAKFLFTATFWGYKIVQPVQV